MAAWFSPSSAIRKMRLPGITQRRNFNASRNEGLVLAVFDLALIIRAAPD
jgi:hypothetical protein